MTKTLRVLVVVPEGPGGDRDGAWNLALNVARGVARTDPTGVHLTLLAPHGERWPDTIAGVEIIMLEPDVRGRASSDAAAWGIAALVGSHDVIHIYDPQTRWGECALLAAGVWARPVCVTERGQTDCLLGSRAGSLLTADAVISPTEDGRSLLGDLHPVEVIPGGVDLEVFQPPAPGGARDAVVCLPSIGGDAEFDRLRRACPAGIQLVMLADAERSRPVILGASVVEGSSAEAAASWYRRAIAVVPSLPPGPERFRSPGTTALGLLEGMACAAPAVTGRAGPWAEHIGEGRTGYVVEDDSELRDRLSALAGSAELVARLGAAGRRECAERWSMEMAGSRLARLYRRLAG